MFLILLFFGDDPTFSVWDYYKTLYIVLSILFWLFFQITKKGIVVPQETIKLFLIIF